MGKEKEVERSFVEIKDEVIQVLRTCYDPEIPVNVYELGLIYEVNVSVTGKVHILMTLTSPNCPAVQTLPEEIRQKVKGIAGVSDVEIELTFDPPWTMDMMSESARLQLGFM